MSSGAFTKRVTLLMLVALWCGGFLTTSLSAQDRLSCEWSHSIIVTANAGAAAHSSEIRVDLSSSDFPAGYSMSVDGADLRVFADNNITAVPFFISRWDSIAQEATIYILPPASIPAGSSADFNFYLGNSLVASASDASAVFPNTGIRVLSRVSSADPIDAASGYTAIRNASSTVVDTIRLDVFRINNQSFGGTNGNYGLCISTLIYVSPAQAGVWDFRAGVDFGLGGHLRLAETDVEAEWNTDLWWATNFNNPDVLQGLRLLTAGWHRLEALGFEGCCDGPVEFQARPPGGNFADLNTTNFTLRAASCTNLIITTNTSQESCPIGLDVTKAAVDFSDILGSGLAIPGTTVTYEILVSNTGQRVDDTTIDILDTLPSDTRLIVDDVAAFELVDGSPASGVTLNWGGFADASDDVFFSVDGTDFTYTPQPDADGADSAITHVRISPGGSLNPADGSAQPSFTVRLKLIIL